MTIADFISGSNLKSIDAKILLNHVAHINTTDIIAHPEKELSPEQSSKLLELAKLRKSGLPIEYIVEKKNFYKDSFFVCEGVLIPQPDTEILVEKAIEIAQGFSKRECRILDLCSGSGCIGISVAKEIKNLFDDFEVVFADISPIAIQCTTTNAKNLLKEISYKIIQGDLFENLQNQHFDLILTNPPYIQTNVIPTLESDVQFEPELALDGGISGLEIIKRITKQAPSFLKTNGYMLMEIGYDQGKDVSSIFEESGFKDVVVVKDLGNRNRVVKGRF